MGWRADVIKMDIAGAEMRALEGMTNILNENENVKIITEFWPAGLLRSGSCPIEFLSELAELGFELCYINEEKNLIEPLNATPVMKKCKGETHVDLFCQKKASL